MLRDDVLREKYLLQVEVIDSDEEDDIEMREDQKILQLMMNNAYADEEIDKLIETFSMMGYKGTQKIHSGELIDNDIRLSENIRNALDDIREIQRMPFNRQGDIERRRFLSRFPNISELIGVSLTVDHLLPCLQELVSLDIITFSLNWTMGVLRVRVRRDSSN